MYFTNLINNKYKNNKIIIIYVDMDGTICDYEVFRGYDFFHKRPLYNRLKLFENLSNNSNIELHILTCCKTLKDASDKNRWLDKYAPFFKLENRHILTKDTIGNKPSDILKLEYLSNINKDNKIILIDDDPKVLKNIASHLKYIDTYKDSILDD